MRILAALVIGLALGTAMGNALPRDLPPVHSISFVQAIRPNFEQMLLSDAERSTFASNLTAELGDEQLKQLVYLLVLDLKPELKRRPLALKILRKEIGVRDASNSAAPSLNATSSRGASAHSDNAGAR